MASTEAILAELKQDVLNAQSLNVVADAGYSNGEQAKACEEAGITPYVPVQRASNNKGEANYFDRSAFSYDERTDSYRCPAGEVLKRKTISTEGRKRPSNACASDSHSSLVRWRYGVRRPNTRLPTSNAESLATLASCCGD